MFKRPHYIAVGVVIVLTVVILKLPSRTTAQLKLAISGLFLPLFGLASSAHQATERAGSAVTSRSDLRKEIERLRQENAELRLRGSQTAEMARENQRLRQQLGLPRQHPEWKLQLGSVVARDPANWGRSLRIDVGLRDGVVTNAPVLTVEGLVGRVTEVHYTQSQVALLGDPDCRVSVMIEETRDMGMITPASSSPLDNVIVDLSYLSRSSPLRAGQRVVTSGHGGVFPKGILVGHIVDFRTIGYGLYNEARVRVAVKMNALEEVFVKLP
jgi:rod shape-determining protein MreC